MDESVTRRTEQHPFEPAPPAVTDDDQRGLLGQLRDDAHRAVLRDDASYLDMAQEKMGQPFGPDIKVSSTRIVMLVEKGNPRGIRSLADLAKRGLRVGTTDPKASTLGALSHELCRETGKFDPIKQNIVMMADTAHTLVQTMEAGRKLDVALVYEANIRHLRGRFDAVPLQLKRALAVQNVAASKTTPYPHLAKRLSRST